MRRAVVATASVTVLMGAFGGWKAWGAATNIEETASGFDNANMLYRYSAGGTQLSAVAIPDSPSGYNEVHDLVVDQQGNVQAVYGGGTLPYLATYNGTSWAFHYALNYSLFGVTYSGAIATYDRYMYLQSQNSDGSGNGIIRFDTSNNYSYTFTQIPNGTNGNLEPQDVTMGMDGGLYVNYYVGGVKGNEVVEFNPVTMGIVKSEILNAGFQNGDHTVVDAQGDIFASGDGYLNKYSPSGTFIKNIALSGKGDLSISSDGKLVTTQNAIAYVFDTNLNLVSSAPIHNAYWGEPFVTWDTYQAPAVALPGDANDDGKVDLTDLSIVLNHFGAATPFRTDGNFDGAAAVDLTDLSDVLNNFGGTGAGAAVVGAPEPGALGVLGIGALGLVGRRRGRWGYGD